MAQILTPTGYKDVTTLTVGDEVLGRYNVNTIVSLDHMVYDATDPEQQSLTYTINGTYSFFQEQLVLLDDVIAMRHARELAIGDVILDDSGSAMPITSITISQATDWWHFHISDDNTFIADGIMLHNSTITMASTGGVLTTAGNWVGGVAPGVGDDAIINATTTAAVSLSGANWSVHGVDFTGYANTFTNVGTRVWTIGGVATLTTAATFVIGSGMTFTGGGVSLTITLDNRSGGITMTTNGKTLNGVAAFNTDANVAASAATTFADSCNLVTCNVTHRRATNVTITSGTTFTCGQYNIGGTTGTSALTYSGATITCTNWANTATNTVTITGNATSALNSTTTTLNFSGNGKSYPGTTTITAGTSTSIQITGANTFVKLFIVGGASVTAQYSLGASQTVTGEFKATGNSASNRLLFSSNVVGTAFTLTCTGATVSNSVDVDFEDITISGATLTGTRIGDWLGNSGITFTTGVNKFWVGDTGTFSNATNHWATSTGGAGGANNYPLPQDTCIWDTNSFSANGQTVTMDTPRMGALDFSLATNKTYTAFNSGGVSEAQTWGNIKFSAQGTFNLSSTFVGIMLRSGTQTFTQNTATVNMGSFRLRGALGTFQLQDDAILSSSANVDFDHQSATTTLDTNGHNLTCGGITNGGVVATFIGSTGKTLTLTAAGAQLFPSTILHGTNNTSQMAVVITDTTSAITSFGKGAWGDLTIANGAAGVRVFNGSPSFNSMGFGVNTPQGTVKITAGTTVTLTTNSFIRGRAGSLVTITSDVAGSAFTLSCSSTVSTDYISLKDSTASGGKPFWAGAHSTDNGNNAGWIFQAYSAGAPMGTNYFPASALGGDVNFEQNPGSTVIVALGTVALASMMLLMGVG